MANHSPSSVSSSDSKLRKLDFKLTDAVWVQCENSDCLKWRQISKAEADQLSPSRPWFCSMNTDPLRRSCEAEEQDYTKAEQILKQFRLRYKLSELEDGTLVWAKLAGYCRWPAVISPDPCCGLSRDLDEDSGEVLLYHVEYLGARHCHSWIPFHSVDPYTAVCAQVTGSRPEGKSRARRKKRLCFRPTNASKQKYQRDLGIAIEEANQLMKKGNIERLDALTFKYKAEALSKDKGRKKNEIQSRDKCVKVRYTEKSLSGIPVRKATNHDADNDIDIKDPEPPRRATIFECLQAEENLLYMSKEEMFAAEVEVYMQKQKTFEDDLRRFLAENGKPLFRTPKWQGILVSPYQLYLAVIDRGGYSETCKKKQWTAVLRELAGENVTSGFIARKFYERYLLAYERCANRQTNGQLDTVEHVKDGSVERHHHHKGTDCRPEINKLKVIFYNDNSQEVGQGLMSKSFEELGGNISDDVTKMTGRDDELLREMNMLQQEMFQELPQMGELSPEGGVTSYVVGTYGMKLQADERDGLYLRAAGTKYCPLSEYSSGSDHNNTITREIMALQHELEHINGEIDISAEETNCNLDSKM